MAIHVLDIGPAEKHRYVCGASTDKALGIRVSSDSVNRLNILPGKLEFGAGSATAVDVNLYRGAADRLTTDDKFSAASGTSGAPGLCFTSNPLCGFHYATSSVYVCTEGADIGYFFTPASSADASVYLSTLIGGATALKKVVVGTAGSGGTGYRTLNVSN
jgi:hypothetical protein